MNSGVIPDSAINGTNFTSFANPYNARLHRIRGSGGFQGLKSSNTSIFIQVDLGEDMKITGFSTQGAVLKFDQFVTSYNISYRTDNGLWTSYTENGTTKVSWNERKNFVKDGTHEGARSRRTLPEHVQGACSSL